MAHRPRVGLEKCVSRETRVVVVVVGHTVKKWWQCKVHDRGLPFPMGAGVLTITITRIAREATRNYDFQQSFLSPFVS